MAHRHYRFRVETLYAKSTVKGENDANFVLTERGVATARAVFVYMP